MSDMVSRTPANICRRPDSSDRFPGSDSGTPHAETSWETQDLLVRQLGRNGQDDTALRLLVGAPAPTSSRPGAQANRRPQRPHPSRQHAPSHRPLVMPRDHRRTERGIGVRTFDRRVGDTCTRIRNLRTLLEARRNQLPDSVRKMFGVLLNQQEQVLAGLAGQPGTTSQIADLRRVQGRLDDVFDAIGAFAALGGLGDPA